MKSKKPYTIIQVIQDAGELSVNETAEKKKAFLGNFKELPLDRIIIRKPHKWEGLLKISGMNNENKRAGVKNIPAALSPGIRLLYFMMEKSFYVPRILKERYAWGMPEGRRLKRFLMGRPLKI